MKFSIKDFFSKCEQIRSLRILSELLKKSIMENIDCDWVQWLGFWAISGFSSQTKKQSPKDILNIKIILIKFSKSAGSTSKGVVFFFFFVNYRQVEAYKTHACGLSWIQFNESQF